MIGNMNAAAAFFAKDTAYIKSQAEVCLTILFVAEKGIGGVFESGMRKTAAIIRYGYCQFVLAYAAYYVNTAFCVTGSVRKHIFVYLYD